MELKLFLHFLILICPPLGFCLNFLLIWLILRKTPKEMFVHSRILLQTCIFDIIFLAEQSIGAPLSGHIADRFFVLFDGYFAMEFNGLFGPHGLVVLYCIHLCLFSIDVFSTAMQFFYRYLIFNRNVEITLFRYLQMLILPIIAIVAIISFFWANFAGKISNCFGPDEEEDSQHLNYLNGSICFSIDNKELFTHFQLWIILTLIYFSSCFAIIFFLRFRIIQFVNGHSGFSENTRRLNKQLTRTLTLLSAYPLIFLSNMIIYAASSYLSAGSANSAQRADHLQLQLWLAFLPHFIPLVNPMLIIVTNAPYRNALLNWRNCLKRQIVPN